MAADLAQKGGQFGFADRLFSAALSAIQASLTASQTSVVSAVRTIRALLRACSMEEITLEGLAGSRSRKSTTLVAE